MLQTDQSKGDVENRERTYHKELKDLRAQLSELAHEKQLQKENVLQAERSIKTIRLELEDKENTVRQLQDEVGLSCDHKEVCCVVLTLFNKASPREI